VKRGVVIVVVLAVALVVAFFATRGGRSAAPTSQAGTSHAGGTGGARAAKEAREAALPAWFATPNVPPRRIAGHVTFEGRPVEGALVTLQTRLNRAGAGAPVELRTGADGAFDFGMRAAGAYDVAATAPGRVPAIAQVRLADPASKPPPDQLELRLHSCVATVTGTIFDASGAGIPHAVVRLGNIAAAESDPQGRYALCVPFGDSELEYGADGYGSVVFLLNVRGSMQHDVVLIPEATISGVVVSAEDGRPVPDAYVGASTADWGRDRAAPGGAISDAEGKFRINRLTPGRYRVYAYADGLSTEGATEALAAVGVAQEIVVRLAVRGRITGKVVRNGIPVAGAEIAAVRKSPSGRSGSTKSQPDGTFVLTLAPPGELVFSVDPYAVKSPTSFKAERGKSYDGAVIDVGSLGSIRGRVTRLGKPVEGADVCCVPTAGRVMPVRSDADGHYEMLGLSAGTYPVSATSTELGAAKLPTKVVLADGEDKTVDLELDLAGTITGVVVDQEGAPVKGVVVRWSHEKTGDLGLSTTDDRGRYRCGEMTGGGRYRAAVFATVAMQNAFPTADGAPYPTLDLEDGNTVVEGPKLVIRYHRKTISGRVVDTAGAPVVDAQVKALATTGGGTPAFNTWLKLPTAITGSDGAFELGELAEGSYALQARSPDGGEGIVTAAAGATGVSIALERPGTIDGTLVGFPQPPVVYATLTGIDWKLSSGVVDGTTFRVGGLRPGRYLVNAQTTYEGDAQNVEVHSGETVKLVMTAKGRGTIDATVLDFRTHTPLAGFSCHVVLSAGGAQGLTNWDLATAPKSDPRGHLVFDPAPAGNVTIGCASPAYRFSVPSADLVLAPGGTASVQLFTVEAQKTTEGTAGISFEWRTTAPRVAAVAPNSSAARAGIMPGDLVVAVDGVSVTELNGAGVSMLIDDHANGTNVAITIARGAEKKTVTVQVEALP
jgi:hypothetical protein